MVKDPNAHARLPPDEATEAVDLLASLRWLYEDGDPVGSALADDALDHAVDLLLKYDLLDTLVTRAAKRYWPRTEVNDRHDEVGILEVRQSWSWTRGPVRRSETVHCEGLKLAALYTFNARCGAAVLLCVVIAVSWYLARNGHPWTAVTVVAMITMMTSGQLLNNRADR
jgi:hypothetical protein